MEQQDSNRELIDHLEQTNTQLTAHLVTSRQLLSSVLSVLGTADRLTSSPLTSQPEAKLYKDWIPQVYAYSGETHSAPAALLAQ